LSKFFIRRPIVAIVIAILTVIVGVITVALLPIAQFPNIAPPEIWLQANYPGADAKTLEQSVATPIEQQVTGVDNMEYMYSVNATNGSQTSLLVDFDLKTDPNMDLILTQSRQQLANGQLPPEVTSYGITLRKSATAPFLLVGLYSPHGTRDAAFLSNYAYINLNDPIGRSYGVGRSEVFGSGQQDYSTISRLNGKPSAIIAIYQLPGSNALQTGEGVRKLMSRMKERFPEDVDYAISLDQTLPVTEGMRDVVETLVIAILLVILVVYLFLQDWRATLIPMLAVPVSLVGTFALFPLFVFSINTLSMLGLVLA